MKNILICIILLTISGLVACGGKDTERAEAPEPGAASTPSAAPLAPDKKSAKIVAFGDSLTAGYGLQLAESYPSLLQKRLEADGYDYDVVNAGVSGDTSAGGVRRIDWALEGDVRVVILELGANDILRGQPISEMKRNLGRIIERAKARGAKVLLAGMEAPTSSGPEYRREVHVAFTEVARRYQIDMIPFFLDRVAGVESLNQADGIHPNPEGTRIVADTVYQHLRPILEEQKRKAAAG